MKHILKSVTAAMAICLAPLSYADDNPPNPDINSMGGDRVGPGLDFAGRSAVVAPNGAAATAHPLATQTAIDILRDGGSAVDAAIAANAMLGLVEPTGNGMGGDLFALIWDPATQQLYGLNASGRSPKGATLADMQAAADKWMDGEEIPPYGAVPVTVPGAVDGWFMMHEKFGKLDMSENLAPAIDYAENGAPIPQVISYYWNLSDKRFNQMHEKGMIAEIENANKTFFSPAPSEGSLFKNPDLANTFKLIGEGGRDAFYKGEIAQTMDAYFKRIGGFLRYEDFAEHHGEWVDPLCVNYRESKVCGLPPNTQGVATLQMLQMLESFPMREYGFGSADSLMAQVEAKRLAFADRARGYFDLEFFDFDPERFIDPNYAELRRRKIDVSTANPDVISPFVTSRANVIEGFDADNDVITVTGTRIERTIEDFPHTIDNMTLKGLPPEDITRQLQETEAKLKEGDTTYLTVADKNGMMVSLIQSNYRGMGSGLVADGLGFMFQDRGQLFSLDPEHPNVFEPGKRPFHTIIPGFAFKQEWPECQARAIPMEEACPYLPWLSFGVMGGGMQPQGQTQIILNLIDYDMGLQEAGDAARWRHDGSCQPTDNLKGSPCETSTGVVKLESGIPESVADELRARGHTVEYSRDGGYGGYQAIMRDFRNGTWIAATEMRKDGSAGGY
jgi:gamma-glutamyltranspeptidase/glutathione hydrolase